MAELALNLEAQTPLGDMAKAMEEGSCEAISLREMPLMTQLTFRGDASNPDILAGAKRALGVDLPVEPNTSTASGDITVIWLGPDEWLILTAEKDAARLISTLKLMVSHQHFAITDVSDNRTCLELSGDKLWACLSKVGHMDFHERSWQVGQTAQTNLVRAQAILRHKDDAPTMQILVRNSFARYLATFLLDSMQEFKA